MRSACSRSAQVERTIRKSVICLPTMVPSIARVKTSPNARGFIEKMSQQHCEAMVMTEKQTLWHSLARSLSSYFSRSGRRVATVLAIVIALLLGYHATFGANGLSAYQQKLH